MSKGEGDKNRSHLAWVSASKKKGGAKILSIKKPAKEGGKRERWGGVVGGVPREKPNEAGTYDWGEFPHGP